VSRLLVARIVCIIVILGALNTHAQDVRIGVLDLFRTSEVTVSSPPGSAVILHIGNQELPLASSSSISRVTVRGRGPGLSVTYGAQSTSAQTVVFTGRNGHSTEFVLSIPGKITRRYRGRLEIASNSGELIPVVTMDLETAVASVVAAEAIPGQPAESLKAQAVAARSYFVAGKGRHQNFDFCDTTHCQFLRSPPARASAAFKAAEQTRGLVLTFDSHVFAAMYTRSCSGRTHTPAQVGLSAGMYPYYAVECVYCRQHPGRWHTGISAQDAADLVPLNEASRLKVARKTGWSTVPSNDFTIRKTAAGVLLDGVGRGHGIGLCQAGSKAMAERGANFREILAHYYPNTILIETHSAAQ
jgi:stage II sporulation protein D